MEKVDFRLPVTDASGNVLSYPHVAAHCTELALPTSRSQKIQAHVLRGIDGPRCSLTFPPNLLHRTSAQALDGSNSWP
jgi:hypothetical protein